MEYQVTLSTNARYVKVTVYRPMNSELGKRLGADAARLAGESNVNRYLFDVRNAPNEQCVSDNYEFANKEISGFGFPKESRSAFLIREDDNSHDFIEAAFQEAGYDVKIFVDESSAVSWLKKE